MRRSASILAGILVAARLAASDHIDGPVTTSHRVADLTDLYAFPSPGRPGWLTVVLDAYPLVPADGHFSERVTYTILVRRAAIREAGEGPFVETGDEAALECTFTTPHATAAHAAQCRGPRGLLARSAFGAAAAAEPADGSRLYAGMRSDPFFLNAGFFSHAKEGKLDPPRDDDVMRGANVLALVLEVDLRRLFPSPPALVAVAAEATTRDAPEGRARRLDRIGRPEITNLGLAPRVGPDLRDVYNLERPFREAAGTLRISRRRLAENVAHFDGLDGRRDWPDGDLARLTALLASDFLVVDLEKPCPAGSFLEIERALLGLSAHRTCGGRRLEDDVVDALFTLYVAGLDGAPVRDGVDRPASALSDRFPYLAPPDLDPWSRLRVYAARRLLAIPDRR